MRRSQMQGEEPASAEVGNSLPNIRGGKRGTVWLKRSERGRGGIGWSGRGWQGPEMRSLAGQGEDSAFHSKSNRKDCKQRTDMIWFSGWKNRPLNPFFQECWNKNKVKSPENIKTFPQWGNEWTGGLNARKGPQSKWEYVNFATNKICFLLLLLFRPKTKHKQSIHSRKSVREDIFTYVKCSNPLVFHLNSWKKVQVVSY